MRKPRKPPKPKAVKFEPVPGDHPSWQMLRELVAGPHSRLAEAKIVLWWRKDWNADADGRLVLGKCLKAPDLWRELSGLDFVIVLNESAWGYLEGGQQHGLVDHELCHAGVSCDKNGEPKRDAEGRVVYRTVKHVVEEFPAVVARHGLYLADVEALVKAAMRHARGQVAERN